MQKEKREKIESVEANIFKSWHVFHFPMHSSIAQTKGKNFYFFSSFFSLVVVSVWINCFITTEVFFSLHLFFSQDEGFYNCREKGDYKIVCGKKGRMKTNEKVKNYKSTSSNFMHLSMSTTESKQKRKEILTWEKFYDNPNKILRVNRVSSTWKFSLRIKDLRCMLLLGRFHPIYKI